MAQQISLINAEMMTQGAYYILLGFGRWGTVNPRLGIPVLYAQVSHAKVIAEISTPEIDVEPSQGTHFFHNIASSRIGYLSIDLKGPGDDDFIDWEWLAAQPTERETEFLREIKLESACVTKIDGKSGRGMIFKPPTVVPHR